jgi:hypothetical protein
VLAHYRRDRARKAARSWPIRRNLGHGFYRRGLLPAVTSGAFAPFRRPLDERRLNHAAHALQAAARSRPTLSSDAAWERAVGELSLRLEAVARARSLAA